MSVTVATEQQRQLQLPATNHTPRPYTGPSREEVLAVNGFDERLGYGGLDREFGERLERCGMRGIQARYSLICLHLDHPRPYRADEIMAANKRIRRENAKRHVRRTAHGLITRQATVQRG